MHSLICIHFWVLFLHIHSYHARTLEVDANIVPQSHNKHLTDSYVFIYMHILFTEVLHKGWCKSLVYHSLFGGGATATAAAAVAAPSALLFHKNRKLNEIIL